MPIVQVVEKLWGREIWHHNCGDYCMKTLELRQGAMCSLHYHPVKRETFLVVRGVVSFELDGVEQRLSVGESIDIPPTYPHRFRALTKRAVVIEASTQHSDEDVVRIEDSRII